MIKHIRGEAEINDYVAPASTEFAFNDVVTRDANGRLAKATASTPRSELLGLIQATISSTDSNYASTKVVPVLEFNEEAEFEADVDTGTAVSTMVGKRFDLNDHNGLNVQKEGQKHFQVTGFVSASKVRGKFITAGDKMRLVSYQETISVADFTDGGGAVGTLDLKAIIPAGAVFARSLITNVVGWAGDTSAVLTLGDGTDVDRYNTGTPSIFATAVAGADAGAPSGTLFHADAKTVTATVTTNADFTACKSNGSGRATITLFYYVAE